MRNEKQKYLINILQTKKSKKKSYQHKLPPGCYSYYLEVKYEMWQLKMFNKKNQT